MWARQTQRWSPFDFEGPARDGFAVDWPIRYKDLASWYSYVEKFAGISGNRDNIASLPDGEFLPPLELSCVENYFSDVVKQHFENRHVIYGRCAHLTVPQKSIWNKEGHNVKNATFASADVHLVDISVQIR